MRVGELEVELQRRRVPAIAYSIGRDANEAYCLVRELDGWHVYYSERGNRNSERVHAAESVACQDLLERLLRDGSVQRWIDERRE
jgi:hypothetical protein